MQLEEWLLEKEVEMQQESRQFQMQMMQVMAGDRSITTPISPFPPPLSSSTQYSGSQMSFAQHGGAPRYYPPLYDDDETQV